MTDTATLTAKPAGVKSRSYVSLTPGDPAPWFHQRSGGNPRYAFDTAAGRYIVMCFYLTVRDPQARLALDAVAKNRKLFDDERLAFFGVSLDPADEKEGRVKESMPGIRFLWDFDAAVSKLYGAVPADAQASEANMPARRFWMVLDPTLRVTAVFPFQPDGGELGAVFAYLKKLPKPEIYAGVTLQAPVIFLRDVFEPAFCKKLIGLYETNGGTESGFMREVDGKTVHILDRNHKSRSDYLIEDEALIKDTQNRIQRRILPEIKKVHQFTVTRMERYIVSCYTAEAGGHFRQHRDNTTKGTAHRRFAVSINLNDDFEGGELNFPEYGPRSFKMPTGAAVVFSCSLLHAVSPVTKGKRYAFLPFLYDDAAARLRLENNKYLGDEVPAYRDPDIENMK
ncbi:MAG TPA: 2OG-Fe(II) oxygenase [Rhizomicrobium sp.]|jgi:peroxiredoxin|nr:2OG-Fe(II) oxygenase [Rhizomicrobium sp.]